MKVVDWFLSLHEVCQFQTKEGAKVGKASKSEIRRWIQNSALHINGVRMNIDDELPEDIESVVLFPKNKERRTTLW